MQELLKVLNCGLKKVARELAPLLDRDVDSLLNCYSGFSSFSTKHNGIEWCHELSFWAEPGPLVALASFPGSGNTWLRYLLQQSTGKLGPRLSENTFWTVVC